MVDIFVNFISNDYVLNTLLVLMFVIPILAFIVYEIQPEWYKNDQENKYAKVTLMILIISILVLVLDRLEIIK